ncbi:glycosyltransferase [Hansschlegelia sp.]|uniref:glycosyltransferase n=1 Tax=Hansschlegelia sp. TaxID=2041892 RepID=UPI002BF3F31F|nr:glycosyltransferase [Hansschlegelia sp.]HVI28790.1 glycosyltransferase [Hansschlegelia sp.]
MMLLSGRPALMASDEKAVLEGCSLTNETIELTIRTPAHLEGEPQFSIAWRPGSDQEQPRKLEDIAPTSQPSSNVYVYHVPIRAVGATVRKEWIISFRADVRLRWPAPHQNSPGSAEAADGRSLPISCQPGVLPFRADIGRRTIMLYRTEAGALELRLDRRTGSLKPTKSGKRIMMLVTDIRRGGGKTKAVFQLAEALATAGHDVRVTALWFSNKQPKFRFPDNIGFDFIDGSYRQAAEDRSSGESGFQSVNKNVTKATDEKLVKYFKEHDLDFIYVPNYDSPMYTFIKASVGPQTVLVIGDHNPRRPEMVEKGAPNEHFVWALNNFDGAHTVNPLIGELLQPLTKKPVFAIPNMADLGEPIRRGEEFFATRKLISIGRLVGTKRMSHVIDAFGLIADQFPEWSLDIFGEGERRPELEEQIERLALGDRARLRGFDREVTSVLAAGAIFVTGSAAEAHPLVLIEAMVAGCPVVSYDKQYGAKYMIKNNKTGFLARDNKRDQLAAAMAKVMTMIESRDEKLLEVIKTAEASVKKFDRKRISALWVQKVDELCAAKRAPSRPTSTEALPDASVPTA